MAPTGHGRFFSIVMVRLRPSIIGQKKSTDRGSVDFLPTLLTDTTARLPGLYRSRDNQARFTFSSILKTPLGERTKRRLKALPKHRRSRVLRRVRLISAMMISVFLPCKAR